MKKKVPYGEILPKLFIALVLIFLYLPIIYLVLNSFNASRFGARWGGFSFKWYEALFQDENLWRSIKNTGIVAIWSTLISVILGTVAGYALARYKSSLQKIHSGLIQLPLILPDILMGMSLLLFFIAVKLPLSLTTITLGHITFSVSYVAVTVQTRFQDFDYSVVEAAQDLGAGIWTILFKIYLPLIMPGILSGGMLALTLSLDDFIISFFTAGPGSSTLPIQIYSMIRFGNPPVINALSTLFLAFTFLLAIIYRKISSMNAQTI